MRRVAGVRIRVDGPPRDPPSSALGTHLSAGSQDRGRSEAPPPHRTGSGLCEHHWTRHRKSGAETPGEASSSRAPTPGIDLTQRRQGAKSRERWPGRTVRADALRASLCAFAPLRESLFPMSQIGLLERRKTCRERRRCWQEPHLPLAPTPESRFPALRTDTCGSESTAQPGRTPSFGSERPTPTDGNHAFAPESLIPPNRSHTFVPESLTPASRTTPFGPERPLWWPEVALSAS
jgi:hypothetical protein